MFIMHYLYIIFKMNFHENCQGLFFLDSLIEFFNEVYG